MRYQMTNNIENCSRLNVLETSLNKRVNLAHYVRWTAAPLQMCGFAAQNFTTHLQSNIRRLRGR